MTEKNKKPIKDLEDVEAEDIEEGIGFTIIKGQSELIVSANKPSLSDYSTDFLLTIYEMLLEELRKRDYKCDDEDCDGCHPIDTKLDGIKFNL